MLTFIALQLSWAVISSYCMHETGRAAQHFGHHQHDETADELSAAAKDKPTLAKKAAPHPHCASCSHATLSPLDLFALPMFVPAPESAPQTELASLTSTFQIPPERPQWLRAA